MIFLKLIEGALKTLQLDTFPFKVRALLVIALIGVLFLLALAKILLSTNPN